VLQKMGLELSDMGVVEFHEAFAGQVGLIHILL
jgi:acetyl-CoA acetyltransferase